MDGVGKDSKGVLILGATNIPWQLDAAIRRRFQRRVHISLPDLPARIKMFELAVGNTPCELGPADYRKLGELSEGYSGSDISIAVQDALMQPVRLIQTATHYKEVCAPLPLQDDVLMDFRSPTQKATRSLPHAHRATLVQRRCPGRILTRISSSNLLYASRTLSRLSRRQDRRSVRRTCIGTRTGRRSLVVKERS